MKSINLKNSIGGAILAFSILFGVGLTSATTAQAQFTYGRAQNDRDRDYNQAQQDRDYRRNRRWRNRGNTGRDGYGNYGGSYELRQTALNAGANEGNKEGRKDRSRGERYDFTDESAYQKATKDYSSRLGDREIYRRYFREAFEHGYADGYGGY
jgi:hypothetical protein